MTYDEFLNFLDKFEEIKSFSGKIRAADQTLQRIGSGSGRVVYDIDGTKVLKVAKNPKGVAQNEVESSVGRDSYVDNIVTKVFESAPDDTWLVAEKAKKVTEKRIKELTGIPSLSDLHMFFRNYDSQKNGGRKIFGIDSDVEEQLYENEFVQELISLSDNYSQHSGDWSRPSSYGEVLHDGQPTIVLTDYGLNDEVYDTHYNRWKKQERYRMYELFDAGDGNDDILSDAGGGEEIRRGMWGLMPYDVSDGDGNNVINEDFISFVLNRDKYPTRPLPSAPYLTDMFHECVGNLKETMKRVPDKKRFYNNLLALQEYLIEYKYYDKEPLLKEEYQIPSVVSMSAGDEMYGQFLADLFTEKVGLPHPQYLGGGSYGHAFKLDENNVLKITSSTSEVEFAFKIMVNGPAIYLTNIYDIYKIVDTENNRTFFALIEEFIPDRPKALFDEYNNQIDAIMPNGYDSYSLMKEMRKAFDYNKIVEIANQVLTATPEANIPEERRSKIRNYVIGLTNIQQELNKFGIKSDDYTNTANLGYKDGVLKFLDVASMKNVSEPQIAAQDVVYLPEDGSSKFSTDDSVGQDDFPPYNQDNLPPDIDNNLDADSALIDEDLEYHHVVGDATQDEFALDEAGKKSWMPNAQTVTVKKKCRLGGLGNTSAACNQGDINNLEFSKINEEIDAKEVNSGSKDDKGSWRTLLKGKRDIAFVEVTVHNYKQIKKLGLGVIPVRVKSPNNTLMSIVYRPNAAGRAERLRQIAISHQGYLNDKSPEEAREIGKLLEYNDASIEEYVRRKYGSKIPVINEPSPDDFDDLAEENNMMNEIQIMRLEEVPFKEEIYNSGGKIYSVGGAVRDEFLGKESKDLDILITGIPMEQLEEILSRYGRVDAVGKSFGILKFKPKGASEEIDIAIPRTEKPSGEGGHKGFDVTSDHALPIEKDLERRDFTINSIAKDIDGNIIDPYNGREDLQNKIIRVVNPEAFSDDPLRMLRAVQFASRFGFEIEPKTMKMIQDYATRIKEIPSERILTEFDKIVKKGNKQIGAELLQKTGLFREIFGFDLKPSMIGRSDFDSAKTMGEFIFLLTRYMSNPAEFYKNNLKGDIPTYKEIKALQMAYDSAEATNLVEARGIAHNMYLISPQSLQSEILPTVIKTAASELLQGKYPKGIGELAVNGNDLMAMGFQGKEIGDALKNMLLKIYSGKIRNNKEELVNLAQQSRTMIKEVASTQVEYGCLMLFLDVPVWEKITSVILPEDLYVENNEYGIEKEPHLTILYGFHDEVTAEDAFKLFKENMPLKPIEIGIRGISMFQNPKFDVVKFDVNSPELIKLNQIMRQLPNTSKFPDYHPHITIAYVKSGEGEKYVKLFEKERKLRGNKLVFTWKGHRGDDGEKLMLNELSYPQLPSEESPKNTWMVNGQQVDVNFFADKYYEWNQGGYDSASEASVLEFLENNYEDFIHDEVLKKELLHKLVDNEVLDEAK